jgi:ribosomal protein S18 acetylase RimI-like enzyme
MICFVAETDPHGASGVQDENRIAGAVRVLIGTTVHGTAGEGIGCGANSGIRSGEGIGTNPGIRSGAEIGTNPGIRSGEGIGTNPGLPWPRDGVPALTLAVRSGFQRKGVGSNLLRRMHRALAEQGFSRVSVWLSGADPAFDFFLKEGYLITAERGEGYDLIRPLGTTLRVRRISLEEVPEAAALITASWQKAYRGIVDDDFLDGLSNLERTRLMTKMFEEGQMEALILFVDGRMAGVSVFGPSMKPEYPDDGEITAFYLRPERFGSGYGHPLFMATRRELQRRGYAHLVLDVFSENLRAIHFYVAHGFSRVQRKDLVLGEKRYDFDIMRMAVKAPR